MGRTGEGKIEFVCETCGKPILAYRASKRRFCSHKCRPANTYSYAPHVPAGTQKKTCLVCGKEYSNHRSKAKYCSLVCAGRSRRISSPEECLKQRIIKAGFIKIWNGPSKGKWIKKESLIILSECPHKRKKEHHHPDYTKPREVQKLCKPCHSKEHMRLRNIAA